MEGFNVDSKLLSVWTSYGSPDNWRRMAQEGWQPYQGRSVMVMICVEGSAEMLRDARRYKVEEKTFFVAGPESKYSVLSYTEDFKADVYLFSVDYLSYMDIPDGRLLLKRVFIEDPCYRIPDDKFMMCRFIHHYLRRLQEDVRNKYREPIIKNYIFILFYEACNLIVNTDSPGGPLSHGAALVNRFLAALETGFRERRTVGYYASALGISQRQLTAVCLSETGRSASAWIDEYTLLEAERLLAAGEMTMQAVAYELGFSSPSHFGRFFKLHKGKSPGKYVREIQSGLRKEDFPAGLYPVRPVSGRGDNGR